MRRTQWALAALAVAAGVAAQLLAARHGEHTTYAGHTPALAALELAASWSLVAVGLASIRTRPWAAALAVAAGIAWLAPDFVGWDAGPAGPRSIATLFTGVTFAAAVALVAGAPGGRPPALVAAILGGELLLVTIGRALVADPFADPDCWSNCASNALLIHPDPSLADALRTADRAFTVTAALALALLTARRLATSSRGARRALAPMLCAGTAFALSQAAWALQTPREDLGDEPFAALFAARCVALIALAGALTWLLVRARRARTLVENLGTAPPAGTLERELARVTGDTGLRIVYPLAPGDYVDADGRPSELPADRALTSIERDGYPLAVVIHDPAALTGRDVARDLSAVARVAVDNERLHARSQFLLAELRASRARIVQTADATRRRLERDLHDGAQQRLVGVALLLELAGDTADPAIVEAQARLRDAIGELRVVAHGIYPTALIDEGLGPAIRALADRRAFAIAQLDTGTHRLAPDIESAAYFLVDAATRGARDAHVALRLQSDDLHIEAVTDTTPDLRAARDRIAALDGTLSAAPPRTSATIPLRPPRSARD